MAKQFVRCSDLEARDIDEDIFLIDEEGGAIHHLNATGAAVWRILDQPRSKKDVAGIVCDAFPHEDKEIVIAGVSQLLKQLRKKGLIKRI